MYPPEIVMDFRYFLDPDTGQPHIHGHGVTEAEVEFIVQDPGEDLPGRDGCRQALGKTEFGRYLRVIYVPDPDSGNVFIVTAYELNGKPLAAYRRRQRRRGR